MSSILISDFHGATVVIGGIATAIQILASRGEAEQLALRASRPEEL